MQDYNIIPCVDYSIMQAPPVSDTIYTRIFGKGRHNLYQFIDDELQDIDQKITNSAPDTAILSFHNVRMYKDAARYKTYKATKTFPSVTRATGKESLKLVLMEDAQFPTTKHALIKDQGWKVIDLTADHRIHAHILLDALPNRPFKSVQEVLSYI